MESSNVVVLEDKEFLITPDNIIAKDFEVLYKGLKLQSVAGVILNSSVLFLKDLED